MRARAGLQFGVGRATITPPAGLWLSGFSLRDGPMEGIRDDLYATAVVLTDGACELIVVGLDLVGLPVEMATAVRQEIARGSGIPPEAVLLACSHSHAGPATGMLREPQDGVATYMAALALYIRGAVRMARRAMQPGEVHVARGHALIGYNRRRPSGAPPTDTPDPDIDDSVLALRLVRPDGATGALLACCSCHPVTLGHGYRLASADYVGVTREIVERVTGAPLLFLQGACADVNPRHRTLDTDAGAVYTGRVLAAELLRLHETAERSADQRLSAVGRSVSVAMQPPPSPDEVALRVAAGDRALQTLGDEGASPGPLNTARFPVDAARDLLTALDSGQARRPVDLAVTALRIGPVGLIALPVEPFSATGLAVRDRRDLSDSLPLRVVVGYANGCLGYLPPPDAYPAGGYEVETAHQFYRLPLPLAPGAEPLVRATALDALSTFR